MRGVEGPWGGGGVGGGCRGKKKKKINHIILLWPCFIDLCWCSHISYLICIYWRAFRTMWAIWAMRENRAALPSLKLRAYGLEWRPRGGKEKKKKKSAGYLDAPAAYITRKYSRSPGMELRPQSGHRRVLADWIDLMHMVTRSVCSRAGVPTPRRKSPRSLRQTAVKKSRESHFPNTKP